MLTINQAYISNNYSNKLKANKKVTTNPLVANNQVTKTSTNFKSLWGFGTHSIKTPQNINKVVPFRESALKQFEEVYANYHKSLNEVSIEDIKNVVTNIEKTTDYPREKILATMQKATQFANLRSLDLVVKSMYKNDILKVGESTHTSPITENMFGLNRTLNYLIVSKNMGFMRGEDAAVFLDKNKIEQLNNPNCIDAIKNHKKHDIKFFVLSGFEDGINFLNRTKDLETTTRKLLAQGDVDKNILEQANKLGIKPIIIKNEQEPTIENIYNQMRPEQMSKEELNATIDANLYERFLKPDKRCDAKSSIIQYLDNALNVYTPESISKSLKDMHKLIVDFNKSKGKSEDDIMYIIPLRKKSYNMITHQYQLINDIPQKQIFDLINVKTKIGTNELKNKTFVILDDSTISGESLEERLIRLYDKNTKNLERENNNIIIAPIFSTNEGKARINSCIRKNDRKNEDILITEKKQPKLWNANITDKDLLNMAVGDCFYDFYNPRPQKSCIIFPYMAPDNNSEFAANIALLHNVAYRLTGETKGYHTDSIKSYTTDCGYIADSAKKILESNSQQTKEQIFQK